MDKPTSLHVSHNGFLQLCQYTKFKYSVYLPVTYLFETNCGQVLPTLMPKLPTGWDFVAQYQDHGFDSLSEHACVPAFLCCTVQGR